MHLANSFLQKHSPKHVSKKEHVAEINRRAALAAFLFSTNTVSR